MKPALTDSRMATLCAEQTLSAFREFESRFDQITKRGRDRFLARDWRGSFGDAAERLRVYSNVLDTLVPRITVLMGERLKERPIWSATKAVYSSLIAGTPRWEIAESFFNSVTRRTFTTEGVDQAIEFIDSDFDVASRAAFHPDLSFHEGPELSELILEALTDRFGGGDARWNSLPAAVDVAAERLRNIAGKHEHYDLEVMVSPFYRGRGAYIVARLTANDPEQSVPIAFCLRHPDKRGIMLDAVLAVEADLAILFSYTRAYFRVETASPFQLVRWLQRLMPGKRLADLYNAIGYNRHAKTEFYRDFVRRLESSPACFVTAPGARGMVMIVFTLPGYDAVFKIIRDQFDAPKENSRADVIRRYRIVFEHDRAGRLVEAHEFEHVRIRRDRFDPGLLEELLHRAAGTVRLEDGDVIIAHVYAERRVDPLNLFLRQADDDRAIAAACDYGQAIKDLAASNIFPGDLLTKNFGVTRRGRVVFYDYDELCFITECNFRRMPEPRTYEEEIAAEPWFSVGNNDVFPEEFPNFLRFPDRARQALVEHHGDLFEAQFWRNLQEKLKAGELPEIFPYAEERRLTAASSAPAARSSNQML